MSKVRIEPLEKENAQGQALELLTAVENKLGFIPNLMKTFANSPVTFQSYLTLSDATKNGELSKKLTEQIALTVAQSNECNYCLSAHTAIGKSFGLTSDEILENRQGAATDAKVQAALTFAQKVTENKGVVSDGDLRTVQEAGYSKGEVLEIVLNVVANILTNYVNHIAGTEVDFPSVKADELSVAV